MNFPKELKYVKSHEWVKDEGDGTVTIGITDFAQDALGDLVFVNLPEVGDEVTAGESFADVESVKAVSDVFSPVTGIIKEINEELLDSPEMINSDPYGAWFIRVEQITDHEEFLDAEEYEAFAESEAE
ncbi:MAG: glycine cleavage system protein GcvH [Eubacteriales bacterium]|nr:glycine cleavage system protein GcvH [Eubacteriales bacterium]